VHKDSSYGYAFIIKFFASAILGQRGKRANFRGTRIISSQRCKKYRYNLISADYFGLVASMNSLPDTAQGNQSSTQRTYLTLRNEIITGRLEPGKRLKVEALKESYGTGASPIREALSLLTSDQLVERLDQRGFRVAETSRQQFQEILNLRCTLEDMALRQSVANGGREWEDQLVLVHHYMGKTDRSETELFEERHKSFHMTLLSACESPILLRLCSQLYDLNVRYRFLAGRSKSYGSRNVEDEHQAILDAAVAREVEESSRLLMEHYRSTGAFLAEQID